MKKIYILTAIACLFLIGFSQHDEKDPQTGRKIPQYMIDSHGREYLLSVDTLK